MKSVAELDKKAERKAPSLLDQPRRCVPPGAGHFSARARRTFLPRSQSHREKRMQATVARAAAPVAKDIMTKALELDVAGKEPFRLEAPPSRTAEDGTGVKDG